MSKRSLLVRADDAVGPRSGDPGRYRTTTFMSVPILVGDVSLGVLNVADPVDGRSFGENDLLTLELLASHIGAVLLQREQGEAMQKLAETDRSRSCSTAATSIAGSTPSSTGRCARRACCHS